jgi:hypothetical protein
MTLKEVTVRLILPSGVKEICGEPEVVMVEMQRLIDLEKEIGTSYAEIIPFPTAKSMHPASYKLKDADYEN